uniref:RNA-directed DNA polymerase n=1 Tax=Cacopsylla melanoneura TaxID=428564 RepID=A0A8D8XH00_9HEMI
MLIFVGYSYQIKYIKGADNVSADILSRLPVGDKNLDEEDNDFCGNFYLNFILEDIETVSELDLVTETQNDYLLRQVHNFIVTSQWPVASCNNDLKPFFIRRHDLSVVNGLILWGHRLVIPGKFRKVFVHELHSTHLGVVKMKSVARSYLWWPEIDLDIENISKSCTACLQNRDNPPKGTVHSWPTPSGPGMRVHVDFLGPFNTMFFLVIIDSYSKWLFVRKMKNITTQETINAFREYFSLWGIPRTLCSDNGPSLCSKEMESFLSKNGVHHILTPPFNPSSNGAAENAVRTCKNFLKKTVFNTQNVELHLQRFMLAHNSTKHCASHKSPAELHLGRPLCTALDRLKN